MRAPSGTATTVASVMPVETTEIALPRCLAGARLVARAMAVGVAMDEPSADTTLAASIHPYVGAVATSTLPRAKTSMATPSVERRFHRPSTMPNRGAETA